MTLSSQLTSLPLSQRLQKLGVPQTAYFIWWWNGRDWLLNTSTAAVVNSAFGPDVESYSAYTVSELGMLLPELDMGGWIATIRWPDHWRCNLDTSSTTTRHFTHADTEAEARGLLLAYLIENGLLQFNSSESTSSVGSSDDVRDRPNA